MPVQPPTSDAASIAHELQSAFEAIQSSFTRSLNSVRLLERTLQKQQRELAGLRSKLEMTLAALPPQKAPTKVPKLNNKKKALTLAEIDQIASLVSEGEPVEWIAAEAECSPKNIELIVKIAAFPKEIRSAIDEKICSAHFSRLLVQKNGERAIVEFVQKVRSWYRKHGIRLRNSEFLLSKGNIAQYARFIQVAIPRTE